VETYSPNTKLRKESIVSWTNGCVFLYGMMGIMALVSAFLPDKSFGWWSIFPLIYLYCHFFFLLRVWQEIPKEFARTTPGMAAGLALVPIFHLYWQFVAFLGLYQDMNKAMESYGHEPRFGTAFVKFVCIAWVVLFVLELVGAMVILVLEEEPSQYEPSTMMIVFATLINLVGTALTIAIYLITQKKVFEFIDIKSSAEQ